MPLPKTADGVLLLGLEEKKEWNEMNTHTLILASTCGVFMNTRVSCGRWHSQHQSRWLP